MSCPSVPGVPGIPTTDKGHEVMTETNATNESNGIADVLSAADRDYLALQWREAVSKRTVYHGCGCSGHRSFVPVGEQTFEIRHIDNPARVHVAVEGMIRCRVCGHDQQYMICAKYPVERPFVTDNTEALAALAHVRTLDVQPGDVFALELPDDYDTPEPEEIERIVRAWRQGIGRDDVKLVVTPPGTKLEKQPAPRRLGILGISKDLLAAMIGLPSSARIDAMSEHLRFCFDELAVRIEHASLPAVEPGKAIVEIQPAITPGQVSTRTDWSKAMPGTLPTMRPDAAKLVALLQRVSEEFVRCNADAGVHSEVVGAILELSGRDSREVAVPPGAKIEPLTYAPSEMGYAELMRWATRESGGAYVPGEPPVADAGGYFFAPVKAQCKRDVSVPVIEGITGTADGRAFTDGTLMAERPFADLFRAYREGKLADPDLCALIAQLERQGLLDKDGMPIPAVPKGGPSRKIEMLYVTTVENADPDCRIKPAEPEEPPGEDKVEPSGSERKVNFREFL